MISDSLVQTKGVIPDVIPICPICGKPCPVEDCITDAQGRAVHRECYRTAIIDGRESL
jgi:hypothetical protein